MRDNIDGIDYIDIGQRIRQRREAANLTQEKLANKAELETPTISKIENGKTKISLPSLIRIANALEVSTDELLCGSLTTGTVVYQGDIMEQLEQCSVHELRIIKEMMVCLLEQLRAVYR